MNKSVFNYQMDKHNVKFDLLWKDIINYQDEEKKKRQLSDKEEESFWKKHSKVYDLNPNVLDSKKIQKEIYNFFKKNKKVIEIGSGTGRLTTYLSKISKKVIAIDPSIYMHKILKEKLNKKNIKNVEQITSKYEDSKDIKADFIVSVNGIYRIKNIKETIIKMIKSAHKRMIVWTMGRNNFDKYINEELGSSIGRKQEYIYLLNILYSLGVDFNIKNIKTKRNIEIDKKEYLKELKEVSKDNKLNYKKLKKEFLKDVKGSIYNKTVLVSVITF